MWHIISITGAVITAIVLIGTAYTGNGSPLVLATVGATGWVLFAALFATHHQPAQEAG